MVMSSFVAGAEMMTFLTVLPRWALAFAPSVKKPVDSTTTCAPTEAQSSLDGSRSAKTFIVLPSTVMESAVKLTSFFRLPRIESYFSRWASMAGVVKSLTATNSMSGLPSAARYTLRPMRPKPLMPTFTAIIVPAPVVLLGEDSRAASRSGIERSIRFLGEFSRFGRQFDASRGVGGKQRIRPTLCDGNHTQD